MPLQSCHTWNKRLKKQTTCLVSLNVHLTCRLGGSFPSQACSRLPCQWRRWVHQTRLQMLCAVANPTAQDLHKKQVRSGLARIRYRWLLIRSSQNDWLVGVVSCRVNLILLIITTRVAVVFAIQSWLAESPSSKSSSPGTSGLLTVGMACKL